MHKMGESELSGATRQLEGTFMSRKIFLTLAAVVALGVGAIAVAFPAEFLASKGTLPSGAADLWMRETGLLLVCMGIIVLSVRNQPDSPAMEALMLGNLLAQLGLLSTELAGYAAGVITKISGIAPNLVLHIALASGFAHFWSRIKIRE